MYKIEQYSSKQAAEDGLNQMVSQGWKLVETNIVPVTDGEISRKNCATRSLSKIYFFHYYEKSDN